jgi:uncharacterized protein (DUF433 family)
MNYQDIITINSGKRGGRPCVRGMRIAVADVLGWLVAGMSHQQILDDYPELMEDDIRACLAYAADGNAGHLGLTPEQIADVNRIREDLKSGRTRLATNEETAALWKKCGL